MFVDVLGLERDGTNGLDQKFGLQNYWIFHLSGNKRYWGWCLLIFVDPLIPPVGHLV